MNVMLHGESDAESIVFGSLYILRTIRPTLGRGGSARDRRRQRRVAAAAERAGRELERMLGHRYGVPF